MKPLRQLREDDCFRTCIAMLLDLEPHQVPNFYGEATSDNNNNEALLNAIDGWIEGWLNERGHYRIKCFFPANNIEDLCELIAKCNPKMPAIISGVRQSNGEMHSIVVDVVKQGLINPSPIPDYLTAVPLLERSVWVVEWIVRAPELSEAQRLAAQGDDGWANA